LASTEEVKDWAWERDWKGLFVSGTFTDPCQQGPPGATSIATTFHDGIHEYDFPARACDAVILAKATGIEERLAHSRSFVYSRSTLEILRVLKGKSRNGIRSGVAISAVQFGGSVRFPSGHVETFILAGNRFLELGKQYIILMWKKHPSTDTYIVAEAYLISDNLVFPINTIPDQSTYDGMALDKFEAKVKAQLPRTLTQINRFASGPRSIKSSGWDTFQNSRCGISS